MAKWNPGLEIKLWHCGKKAVPDQEAVVTVRCTARVIQSMIPLKGDIGTNPGLYSLDQCSSSDSTWHFVQNWLPAWHGTYQCKPFKGNGSATNSDSWVCKKRIHHFAISDRSAVVCLLWDLGEKELSGAESWCLLTEGSAWGVRGRSGSYWQWLKQIKHQNTAFQTHHLTPAAHETRHNASLSDPKRVLKIYFLSREIATWLYEIHPGTKRNVRASRM